MIDLDSFIGSYVVKRERSMFVEDILTHALELEIEISGKKVLVIGGAGTIGSSFIKTLLVYKPAKLVVLDINENGLTELTRDLRSTSGLLVPVDYTTYPISYHDPIFKKIYLMEKGFDIVANFSAHKHVRSEKDIFSVEAMLENNVFQARNLLNSLLMFPPNHFFCVSTDKAANPVNIMGASKKLMEELIMSYSPFFKVTSARFANVAFSNGSLLDGFLNRVMKRQPIVVPTNIKRYFVSPLESGQICLLACILGKNKDIFFPKLNETQMLGFDLICENFLEHLGYKIKKFSNGDDAKLFAEKMSANSEFYPVVYENCDTTGEKAFEEFYVSGEIIDAGRFQSLGVIKHSNIINKILIEREVDMLRDCFKDGNIGKEAIIANLSSFIPSFKHQERGKQLDQKM